MDLQDKVALVTGAASGIGRAIALRMAALGARVVVADINEIGGKETVGLVDSAGSDAHFVRCDVTSFDDARATVAKTREVFGRLDVLVNNAGWDIVQPFLEHEPSFWDKVIAINLKGPINMSRAAFEAFVEQGDGGKIVNLASDAGRVGSLGETVYSACKGGIIAFTKALAREAVRHGVLVNAVAPGITDTPLVAGLDQKVMDAIVKTIPMRRMASPDEPAEVVCFLASASNTYVTGQVLSVNGGLTMV
ncbi:MAG: SDR family oxidoreductase [Thermoleophilia bacterium]|nr:SDR family oxidoreductase [Thermoleophilia bacterium]